MKNVLILYKTMPQYRFEFFSLLKKKLMDEGIDLRIVYGSLDSKGKEDSREIAFGQYRENKLIRIGKHQLIWQPCLPEIKDADLVIVEQANKLLINYVLLFRRLFTRRKFAFWGHGLNMQDREKSFLNRFKKLYSNYTDHWFAYTPRVRNRLIESGYRPDRITVVDNAIDTRRLVADFNAIPDAATAALKKELNISDSDRVFIYCGALYKEKRLDFLIETADRIVALGYAFKLLIVGGGPDADFVRQAAASRPWLIMTGPKFGAEKALYFKIADLFLMPGAIGLAVLDAFAFRTPMITTSYEFHGPEFEYLVHDYNGIVTGNTQEEYVSQVLQLLDNPGRIAYLKENCGVSSGIYTVENMVDNFAKGVHHALN
jgi:glycosyltransferase involved in cell wall biosynthesis